MPVPSTEQYVPTIELRQTLCSTTVHFTILYAVEVGQTCSNGIPGVEAAGVCCKAECGTCGGTGCSTRVPGFGQYDCCVGPIVDTGVSCGDSVAAPCIIDEGDEIYPNVSCSQKQLSQTIPPTLSLSWSKDCAGNGVRVSPGHAMNKSLVNTSA